MSCNDIIAMYLWIFYIHFNIKQLLNLHGLGIFCEATISHKISDTYLCFSIVPFTTSEMELEFFT